jgi:hypothetical protein
MPPVPLSPYQYLRGEWINPSATPNPFHNARYKALYTSSSGETIGTGINAATFATYSIVEVHSLTPISKDMPFEEAALIGKSFYEFGYLFFVLMCISVRSADRSRVHTVRYQSDPWKFGGGFWSRLYWPKRYSGIVKRKKKKN